MVEEARFHSSISGGFYVQDRVVAGKVGVRQLVFDTQPEAEQSSVFLSYTEVPCLAPDQHAPVGKIRRGDGLFLSNAFEDEGREDADAVAIDGGVTLAQAVAASVQVPPPLAVMGYWRLRHDYLHFDLHKKAVAALLLLPRRIVEAHAAQKRTGSAAVVDRLLVLGLGGGGLPMFLRHHFPGFGVECVEIDPVVYGVANSHFGFRASGDDRMRVFVEDGLAHIRRRCSKIRERLQPQRCRSRNASATKPTSASQKCSNPDQGPFLFARLREMAPVRRLRSRIIFVDVDDNTQRADGLLCPPASFLARPMLEELRMCLHPEFGILAINLASRCAATFDSVVVNLRGVFDAVLLIPVIMDDEEDKEFRNAIVFALVFNKRYFGRHVEALRRDAWLSIHADNWCPVELLSASSNRYVRSEDLDFVDGADFRAAEPSSLLHPALDEIKALGNQVTWVQV